MHTSAGLRIALYWPLLFLGLAAFLFIRSDPEVWPLGEIGFWDSMRDVEVLQHRFFVALIIMFGLFEWRAGPTARPPRAAPPGVPPVRPPRGPARPMPRPHPRPPTLH